MESLRRISGMVKAVLVPDIIRHRFAGAVQRDSHRRRYVIACPCGCGEIVDFDGSCFISTPGEAGERLLSSIEPMQIVLDHAGVEEVHWSGRLERGEFIEEAKAP
jgi:hypothetical protein